MIRLENFTCGYGRHVVLDLPKLEFAPGKITAVIGRNGSGKSTLTQALAGLKTDFRGKIWLDELKLSRHVSVRTLRQKVGLVLQNPDNQLFFSRVSDDLDFVLQNLNLPNLEEAQDGAMQRSEWHQFVRQARQQMIQETLERVGMGDFLEANPRDLSGGQKQRLAIASVLVATPKYLILDEPSSMLDLAGKKMLYRTLEELAKRGMGIILMTNQLEELLLASRIVILDQGKAYTYSQPKLIGKLESLEQHGLEIPLLLKLAHQLKVFSFSELEARL